MVLLNTIAAQFNLFSGVQTVPAIAQSSANLPTSTVPKPMPSAEPSKVIVEIPSTPGSPLNLLFDPTWIKLWEHVGPISYLVFLCLFIWLLTRLVETVKGK